MKVEKVHNGIRYTLSNEGLVNGDEVFPIGSGRCLDDGGWILHKIDFRDFISGFPDEPHTIKNTHYSDYKPYEVHTSHGYGPIESYFKVIKLEQQVSEIKFNIKTYKWVEIQPEELKQNVENESSRN